ncbi:MAG: hypothetical protein R2734_08665 [Nocardioides sp.]
MRPRTALTILGLVAGLLAPVAVTAVPAPSAPGRAAPTVSVVPVASGLAMPTGIAEPTPGSTDLYILEEVRVDPSCAGGTLSGSARCASGSTFNSEREAALAGLLRLRPQPPGLRRYRRDTGDVQLSRLRLVNDAIKPGSVKPMLRIRRRQASNHNGGRSPSTGRSAVRVHRRRRRRRTSSATRRIAVPCSEVLRLGIRPRVALPSPPAAAAPQAGPPRDLGDRAAQPLADGLRPASRSMWVGDVGQDTVEEVDRPGHRIDLLNLGWSHYEGNRVFDRGEKAAEASWSSRSSATGTQSASIIGGAVYRGSRSPALKSYYVYSDLNGWIAGFSIADPVSSGRPGHQPAHDLQGRG